ncbi:MAG: hypothetical protein HQM08_22190 [Candidatus Riflebacteria bacterium]|nr:hypothetical protein [Candidatus Riflebacteria bacterium]
MIGQINPREAFLQKTTSQIQDSLSSRRFNSSEIEKVPGNPLGTIRNAQAIEKAVKNSPDYLISGKQVEMAANRVENEARVQYIQQKQEFMGTYDAAGKKTSPSNDSMISPSIINYII